MRFFQPIPASRRLPVVVLDDAAQPAAALLERQPSRATALRVFEPGSAHPHPPCHCLASLRARQCFGQWETRLQCFAQASAPLEDSEDRGTVVGRFRVMRQYDADGTLENAERYYFAHDERWRVLGTFRDQDSNPKEAFVHHAAGKGGFGSSSYIDSVILRDRDVSGGGGFTGQSDGTLEERRYYCQNWRADVAAVAKSDGTPLEYVRYSSYGEPTVHPVADLDMDGDVDTADANEWDYLSGGSPVNAAYATADVDFDGDVTNGDGDLFGESYTANAGLSGRGRLSSPGVGSRLGYAGYQWDPVSRVYHVRYRVYFPETGRWGRRDPLGYRDSLSLYQYCSSASLAHVDPFGLSPSLIERIIRRGIFYLRELQAPANSRNDCGVTVMQDPRVGGHAWLDIDLGDGGPGYGVGYYPAGWATPTPKVLRKPGSRKHYHDYVDPETGECWGDSYGGGRKGIKSPITRKVRRWNKTQIWFGNFLAAEIDNKLQFGPAKGKSCSSATCVQIRACLREFIPPREYNDDWFYCAPWAYSCRSATGDALRSCCLEIIPFQ
jgi:RHS repeat-associated protein